MVSRGARSHAVSLSILSKQKEWAWEALENLIRLGNNTWTAVETKEGANSYPAASRWSPHDKGFWKPCISEIQEIGI